MLVICASWSVQRRPWLRWRTVWSFGLFGHVFNRGRCIAGLRVLEVLVRSGKKLSELAQVFEPVPQELVNERFGEASLDTLEKTQALISKIESELAAEGRVLVRYSGTERKARVMVEGPNPMRQAALL